MTPEEMIPFLDRWKKDHQDIDKVVTALGEIVGIEPTSPLLTTLFKSFDSHTAALSAMFRDQYEWLQWYEVDTDMGKHPQKASPKQDVPLRTIATTRDLAVLIYESRA